MSLSPDFILLGSTSSITKLNFYRPRITSETKFNKFLLSGTQDGEINLWNMKSRRIISTNNAHKKTSIIGLASSYRIGTEFVDKIIAQGRDGSIIIWQLKTNGEWINLGSISCAQFTFCSFSQLFINNDLCISSVNLHCNSKIDITSLDSRKRILQLDPTDTDSLNSNVMNTNKNFGMIMVIKSYKENSSNFRESGKFIENIIDTSADTTQLSSENCDKKEIQIYSKSHDNFSSINYYKVLAGYEDGSIIIWDIRKANKQLDMYSNENSFLDEKMKIKESLTNTTKMSKNFNGMNSNILVSEVVEKVHKDTIMCLDYCSLTNRGISGSGDGLLNFWSFKKESLQNEYEKNEKINIINVDEKINKTNSYENLNGSITNFIYEEQNLNKLNSSFSNLKSNNAPINDSYKFNLIKSLTLPTGIGCIAYRIDGKLLSIGCWDGVVQLYGGKSLKYLGSLNFHEDSIQSMQFDEIDYILAVASKDKTISIWSVYSKVGLDYI